MKAQFLDKLLSTPWNIDKARGRAILSQIVTALLKNERPSQDTFGDPLPHMTIQGDVAVIPISGIVHMAVPDWVKAWGFNLTDANDITAEIEQALADPAVSMIVFDVDSPGGSALAGEKLFAANEAANKKKPLFSFVADGAMMASTGYLAAAASPAILAGPFASCVGCIGSYLAMLDDSEYWEKLGIKFQVYRSGEFKAIGEDKITEAQAAYLQSLADDSGARFRRAVAKHRTGISEDDMQGQWFTGTEAAARGFVAGTAKDLNAAIAKFRKML
jgi:protease-4